MQDFTAAKRPNTEEKGVQTDVVPVLRRQDAIRKKSLPPLPKQQELNIDLEATDATKFTFNLTVNIFYDKK